MREIIHIEKIENRQELVDLKRNQYLGRSVSVVYVYYFINHLIAYPKCSGNILYIGESKRDKQPTGDRFGRHISDEQFKGGDTNTNLTLSQYFYENWDIGLKIFEVEERKKKERGLIYAHIAKYGSKPIAQGKVPHDDDGKNQVKHIFSYINGNAEEIDICIQTLDNILNA